MELDHSTSETWQTFLKSGSINWKKALEKQKDFDKHECSDVHRKTKDQYFHIPNSTIILVDNSLSEICGADKAGNCQVAREILENIRFLCRQSLSLRGRSLDFKNKM